MEIESPSDYDITRQRAILGHINKLRWLGERFGDEAKFQGFDQADIKLVLMQEVLLLKLQVFASIGDNLPF